MKVLVFAVSVFGVAFALGEFSAVVEAQEAPKPSGERSKIEQRARKAFHGSDLKGKDGPMAKAGLSLTRLYYRRASADTSESDLDVAARIVDGDVAFNAVATGENGSVLRQELSRLGAHQMAVSGKTVSGLLPIEKIRQAARLAQLESMQPAAPQTQGLDLGQATENRGHPDEEPDAIIGVLALLGITLLLELT